MEDKSLKTKNDFAPSFGMQRFKKTIIINASPFFLNNILEVI